MTTTGIGPLATTTLAEATTAAATAEGSVGS